MRYVRIAAVTLAALSGALTAGSARADDAWSYEASPFLWAAGLDGRVGFNGSPVDVSASFRDLVGMANIGAAMRITAHRPPVGWFGEASWIETSNDVASPSGPVTLETTQTLAEGGLTYEIDPTLAIYGGVRYQNVDSTRDSLAGRVQQTEEWIDGIIGARWTSLASDTWVIWVRADAGAGGSDLVWLAEGGGGYRWPERWSLYMAYRVLDTRYEHGGFLYDIQQSGLLLGFGFRY
jgi:hypothetical protein